MGSSWIKLKSPTIHTCVMSLPRATVGFCFLCGYFFVVPMGRCQHKCEFAASVSIDCKSALDQTGYTSYVEHEVA